MNLDELQSYSDVIDYLDGKGRPRHLLLGNGFSMAYDKDIFSYNALSSFIDQIDDDLLKKLFQVINTKNFEVVMQHLDNFIEIARVFTEDKNLVDRLVAATETLKMSLIDAVKTLHPEHVFKVPAERSEKCAEFLKMFLANGGKVFTTNYDLLLYWVMMRNGLEDAIDGFGKEFEGYDTATREPEFADLCWGKRRNEQAVFYLHGALHLFDTGVEIVKELYDSEHYLLTKIKERIENKDYPIFVTAGNGHDKMTHVTHNKYLQHGFDTFSGIQGSLIVFGFGFGDSDSHIIDAINKAAKHGQLTNEKLLSVYIGVNSQASLDRMEQIAERFQCKVNYYDARTVGVWG
ncbi:MAG: DUF4917 family protein [Acidobacteria bacterium]|nr:DUF4917 family protein [Acidobacteriota bacterium]